MKRFLWVFVAVVATGVTVGVMTAGAVITRPTVAVTVDEFSMVPYSQGALAGKIRFIATNIGKVEHEFVIVKTPRAADGLLGGDHGPTRAGESGAVGEVGSLPPGTAKAVTLTLKRGHYALICNLPGHYLAGQFADFYVR